MSFHHLQQCDLTTARIKSSAQIAYLNHFLSPGLFQYAEELFKRFLRTSPLVDLWKFYLTYVRSVTSTINVRREWYIEILSSDE